MYIALILAAGLGKRISNKTPKQFLKINGKPLVSYCLKTFNEINEISSIFLVVNKENQMEAISLSKKYDKVKSIVLGGETRQQSVLLGLKEIKKYSNKNDVVLIHDSARPLVGKEIILNNIQASKSHSAVVTVFKENNTLCEIDGELITNYIDRNNAYQIQTPQTFDFDLIYSIHQKNIGKSFTDDSQLIFNEDIEIFTTKGNALNFKITTNEDLEILRKIIKKKNIS